MRETRFSLGSLEMRSLRRARWSFQLFEFIHNRTIGCVAELHSEANSHIMNSELIQLTKMVSNYSKQGQVDYARKLFDEMPYRDSVAGNIMIKAYVDNRRLTEARELFDEMSERSIVSWNSMIIGYAQARQMDMALKLFFTMPNKDVISWTTIVSGLTRVSRIADAYRLFRQMPERNPISWSSMISGLQQNGLSAESLSLFRKMWVVGVRPTSHAFTSALAASADLCALSVGEQLYSQLIKGGFESNNHLCNSVITMFMKSGNLDNARRVFVSMDHPDTVTWNSMIVGCGQHGYGMEAIMVFHQMQKAGFLPDDISLLGVLQGCAHSGLVKEAVMLFRSTETDWGIPPGPEHYMCMVDVYSRAGLLKEALGIISEMPFEPACAMWRMLLNGCRIWGDLKMGVFAADHILKIEPYNSSACLMVIDMLVSLGRMGEVEEIRRRMRGEGGTKELAHSWIEVKGRIHLFTMKDETHPELEYIYMTLELLSYDVAEHSDVHLHG